MNILVTGGAGYIGSHTAVELMVFQERNGDNKPVMNFVN